MLGGYLAENLCNTSQLKQNKQNFSSDLIHVRTAVCCNELIGRKECVTALPVLSVCRSVCWSDTVCFLLPQSRLNESSVLEVALTLCRDACWERRLCEELCCILAAVALK